MAIVHYDFERLTNGSGSSINDARNTYAAAGNDDVIRLKPGQNWLRSSQLSFGSATNLVIEPWPTYYDDPKMPKPRVVHSAASTFAWNFQGDGVHTIRDIEFRDCSTNLNGGVVGSGLVSATSVFAQLRLLRVDFFNTAYNAVRLSGVGSQAAPTFQALYCNFDDIGEDAVYGGAINYEVGWSRMTRLSRRTSTGDGLGFLGSTPTRAWVHDSFIDHRGNANKHCIIIDKTGGTAGTGFALIEDNELLADGTVNVNFIGVNGVVRRNRLISGDIAFANDTAGSKYRHNLILVTKYRNPSVGTIGLASNNTEVVNNTFVAAKGGVLVNGGTGVTGTILRNNLVVGGGTFYKRGAGGSETKNNNAFQGTDSPYLNSSDVALALEASDLARMDLADDIGRPLPGSLLLTSGADLGNVRDIRGIQGRKFIGAYASSRLRTF